MHWKTNASLCAESVFVRTWWCFHVSLAWKCCPQHQQEHMRCCYTVQLFTEDPISLFWVFVKMLVLFFWSGSQNRWKCLPHANAVKCDTTKLGSTCVDGSYNKIKSTKVKAVFYWIGLAVICHYSHTGSLWTGEIGGFLCNTAHGKKKSHAHIFDCNVVQFKTIVRMLFWIKELSSWRVLK